MRNVIRTVVLGLSTALLTAASPSVIGEGNNSATGKGSLNFGHEDEGVGFLELNISAGTATSGTLLFAGEHHDHYPDIIVRVDKIKHARFASGSVRFSAQGMLHDEPVRVRGAAWDGAMVNRPDRFSIRCYTSNGELVVDATGELFKGDIVIGTPE
ncbi:MAG: hypothetical protein ACYSU7_18475 [Planctomycetota bacterium]|jgi:hypothetical protein